MRGAQPRLAAYLSAGSAAFSGQRTRTSTAAHRLAREADTQATMTAPGNTFDVIVVGGGISGRRIWPAVTPPPPTPSTPRFLHGRVARRRRRRRRMRSEMQTTVARRAAGRLIPRGTSRSRR